MKINNTAEDLFKSNIGHRIKVEVIGIDKKQFTGLLTDIQCNTMFITNDDLTVDMFRYEDLRYMYLV